VRLNPRGFVVPGMVRFGESLRASLECSGRARPIDLVAAHAHRHLESPRAERLEVHAKAREAGLDAIGGTLVANAGTVFVVVSSRVVKLVGDAIDDRSG